MSENKEPEEQNEKDEAINGEFFTNDDSKLNAFIRRYGGACVGGLIALVLCCTKLSEFLLNIIIILVGAFIGNYVQKNKDSVKESIKSFIDKF